MSEVPGPCPALPDRLPVSRPEGAASPAQGSDGANHGPDSTGPGALGASPASLPQRLPARGGGRATSDFQTLGASSPGSLCRVLNTWPSIFYSWFYC